MPVLRWTFKVRAIQWDCTGWDVPDVAHSKVHIYEGRTDLQNEFSTNNHVGDAPAENAITSKPGTIIENFG